MEPNWVKSKHDGRYDIPIVEKSRQYLMVCFGKYLFMPISNRLSADWWNVVAAWFDFQFEESEQPHLLDKRYDWITDHGRWRNFADGPVPEPPDGKPVMVYIANDTLEVNFMHPEAANMRLNGRSDAWWFDDARVIPYPDKPLLELAD